MAIATAQSNQLVIKSVWAREILDSRGLPTLECSLSLNNGVMVVTSIATANGSKNTDLIELRDGDMKRMLGKGVTRAVGLINTKVAQALVGQNPVDQEEIDRILLSLDASKNLEQLGANTTMVVSQAVLKAAALAYGWPPYYYIFKKYALAKVLSLPNCLYGLIDGGRHGTDNLDFQEFQLITANNLSFERSLEIAVSTFQTLGQILKGKGAIRSVGPNGGYTPNLYKNTDAFDLMSEAIHNLNLVIGRDVFFGCDFDANSFFENNRYRVKDKPDGFNSKEWLEYLQDLNRLYGLYAFEDPFADRDLADWKQFSINYGRTTRIICDSLSRTDEKKVAEMIKEKVGNTLLIKPGQTATITHMIAAAKIARAANWQLVVSNREGETNDDFLADVAVGLGAEFAKFGPPNRGERIVKYNRLLQISSELRQMNANKG